MTYNKVSNKNQDKDVKYLNKDYNSFKNQLIEFAEIYFPNNYIITLYQKTKFKNSLTFSFSPLH